MEHAMTRFHARTDGRCLVVLALPLTAVKRGLAKDSIDQGWIVTCTKGNQGTEGGICLRWRAVARDVPTVKERSELLAVLLLP